VNVGDQDTHKVFENQRDEWDDEVKHKQKKPGSAPGHEYGLSLYATSIEY